MEPEEVNGATSRDLLYIHTCRRGGLGIVKYKIVVAEYLEMSFCYTDINDINSCSVAIKTENIHFPIRKKPLCYFASAEQVRLPGKVCASKRNLL